MSAPKQLTIVIALISLLSLTLPINAAAQEPDTTSALFQMREAERNFARESVMRGRNAAFVDNFADRSVIFTTTWLSNGRQFWKNRKPNAVVLKWEPEFMDISESRDFGISTGPWEAQEYRPFTQPIGAGYFLSVWKKQPDGMWKVILDAGSSTPPRGASQHTFSFPAGADRPVPKANKANANTVLKEVSGKEAAFSSAWQNEPTPATYASFLAPHARMQREGHFPTTDADSISALIGVLPKSLRWNVVGSGCANSGDIAFTYGLLEQSDAKKNPLGHYVRIWKKTAEGRWEIALEMLNLE